jgi:diguanylate cyclase (GGDEF)-like protein
MTRMGLAPGSLNVVRARGLGTLRDWPLWRLSARLRCFAVAVICAALAATCVAASLTQWHARAAVLFGLLLAAGVIATESSRRLGEPAGACKDVHGLWELPMAILLPPFYAMTAPALIAALTQWRVRRSLVHRRVFSAAAAGLANGAASLMFHAVWADPGRLAGGQYRLLDWGLLAAACGICRWLAVTALVVTAVRLDDPAAWISDLLGGGAGLWHDLAELCVGVLTAFCAATGPVLLLFAVPCAVFGQRSVRQAQMHDASRTDRQTGLLSPAAWRREATVQVTRAVRAGTPQAVAIVHIDDFGAVEQICGRAASRRVLRDVAGSIARGTAHGDLPGRFGRDEFIVLLAHADAVEALCIAELLRARISELAITGRRDDARSAAHVTASIGVATLARTVSDLTDLLAAADVALYWAECAGYNSVRLADRPPAEPPAR